MLRVVILAGSHSQCTGGIADGLANRTAIVRLTGRFNVALLIRCICGLGCYDSISRCVSNSLPHVPRPARRRVANGVS